MHPHQQSETHHQAESRENTTLAACLILAAIAITLRATELAGFWGAA